MMRTLAALFAFTVAVSFGAAQAASLMDATRGSENVLSAPKWRPGSRWEYSDGYGLSISSAENNDAVFQRLDAPGQWFSMHGFLRQDASSATALRRTIYRSLPPEMGTTLDATSPLAFQREYMSNGELVVHATSWTVEGKERITVPAGTFDCWVIVWRARSLKSDWTGFERWWYSPEAQLYVRLEYKYGAMEPASRVLTRYRLPDSSPSASGAQRLTPSRPLAMREVPIPALEFGALQSLPLDAIAIDSDTIAAWSRAKPNAPWIVQIEASSDPKSARRALLDFTGRRGAMVSALPQGVDKSRTKNRAALYRAWIGGYDRASEARALCLELRANGESCIVRQRNLEIPLRRD